MKISKEEIAAIQANLYAIEMLTGAYNLGTGHARYHVSKTGMDVYITILYLLGKQQILNGPKYTSEHIKMNENNHSRELALEQKFIDILPEHEYVLTIRGAEHIKVMFDIGVLKSSTPKKSWLNRFHLKG